MGYYDYYHPDVDYCGPGDPSGWFTIHTTDSNNRTCYKHDIAYEEFKRVYGFYPYWVTIPDDLEAIKEWDNTWKGLIMRSLFNIKQRLMREGAYREGKFYHDTDSDIGWKRRGEPLRDNRPWKGYVLEDDGDLPPNDVLLDHLQKLEEPVKDMSSYVRSKTVLRGKRKRTPGKKDSFFKRVMNIINPFTAVLGQHEGALTLNSTGPVYDFGGGKQCWVDLSFSSNAGTPSGNLTGIGFVGQQTHASNTVGFTPNRMGEYIYRKDWELTHRIRHTGISPAYVTLYYIQCIKDAEYSPLVYFGYEATDALVYDGDAAEGLFTPTYTGGSVGTQSLQAIVGTSVAAYPYRVYSGTAETNFKLGLQTNFKQYFKITKIRKIKVCNEFFSCSLREPGIRRIDYGRHVIPGSVTDATTGNQKLYWMIKGEETILMKVTTGFTIDGTTPAQNAYSTCRFNMSTKMRAAYNYKHDLVLTNKTITYLADSNLGADPREMHEDMILENADYNG